MYDHSVVFIEYVTPFLALEGKEGQASNRTKEDFWEEVAIAFGCLEEDYKGNIRRLGKLLFFSQAFWPFWLLPLNDEYCTFLDALEINDYILPIGKYPPLKDVEKELKAKNIFEAQRKFLNYDNYLKKGPSLTRKNERISGYLDRDTFAYLKPHFYKITKLYTDSFFVIPPKIDNDQVLREREKFNDFLSLKVVQELQSQREYTLQLMDKWLEEFEKKLAEIAQTRIDTSEELTFIQQLDEQINEAKNRPFEDSDQDFLSRDEFILPSLSQNIENDISLISEQVQKIRDGLEKRDITQILHASQSAVRSSRDIHSILSQFNKNIEKLRQDMEQERKRKRQQRDEEIKTYEKQRENLLKQLQEKETSQIAGYDNQKTQYESFLRLRQEIDADFLQWIRKQMDEIQDFFNFHAIPMQGSVQIVGVPILIFGFLRGNDVLIIPYLPKLFTLEQQKQGKITFKESRQETRIKDNFNRYIQKKTGNQQFFTTNGKMHDLTPLPLFKENILAALTSMRLKNWISEKKARRISKMLEEEFNFIK